MTYNPETYPVPLTSVIMRPENIERATRGVSAIQVAQFVVDAYQSWGRSPLMTSLMKHPRQFFPGYLPKDPSQVNRHWDKPSAVRLNGALWSFGIVTRALPEGAWIALSQITMDDVACTAGVAINGRYSDDDLSAMGVYGLEYALPYVPYFNEGTSRFTTLSTRSAAFMGIRIPFAALQAYESSAARIEMRQNVAAGHLEMPLMGEIERELERPQDAS